MYKFASLFRYYVGINILHLCRVVRFPSYLSLFSRSIDMFDQVSPIKTTTVSVATNGESQEMDGEYSGLVISCPTTSGNDAECKSKEVTVTGPTFINKNDRSVVSEPRSNSTEESPYDSITFDEFFHVSTGHSSFRGSCPTLAAHCGWLWNILNSPYSIPFWLLLICAPVSATVMGLLYMHSCPGAIHLAILLLSMGIIFAIAVILKIISILHKLVYEENSSDSLKTFFGSTAVITIGLCLTECAYFWQIKASPEPDTAEYCDPRLMTFAFWWNCFIWFGILILFFCQS